MNAKPLIKALSNGPGAILLKQEIAEIRLFSKKEEFLRSQEYTPRQLLKKILPRTKFTNPDVRIVSLFDEKSSMALVGANGSILEECDLIDEAGAIEMLQRWKIEGAKKANEKGNE